MTRSQRTKNLTNTIKSNLNAKSIFIAAILTILLTNVIYPLVVKTKIVEMAEFTVEICIVTALLGLFSTELGLLDHLDHASRYSIHEVDESSVCSSSKAFYFYN